ncbi:hypothetical protein DAMA08_053230 [Martiniozyma asiatica (nom. inval.)]|nr:hypothetical protein DAMA08_053230 [Martiniozyma asiatica]
MQGNELSFLKTYFHLCLKNSSRNTFFDLRNYSSCRLLDLHNNEPPPVAGLSITDPYVIYKSYIKLGLLNPDTHQLALIKRLSQLSTDLQNYQPNLTKIKINYLVRELEKKYQRENPERFQQNDTIADKFYDATIGLFKRNSMEKARKSLILKLNDEDQLLSTDLENIPRGLLVNGEVGCGKSLCIDIFAESLPVKGKWRVHQTVFNQWILKEIEEISKAKRDSSKIKKFKNYESVKEDKLSCSGECSGSNCQNQSSTKNEDIYELTQISENLSIQGNHSLLRFENEFILYHLACRLINKAHVLILDEFSLPDIAMAKITKMLFTYYFKLGGVLVSSSNKVPGDLYSGGLGDVAKGGMGSFERILRIRSDVWDMQSGKDWRRHCLEDSSAKAEQSWLIIEGSIDEQKKWDELLKEYLNLETAKHNVPVFQSYSRKVHIPKISSDEQTAYFTFADLVHDSTYGPADFISIAARFPIIILDHVPVINSKMKNQARNIINFLDAVYDARCNLIIRMENEPEEIFFPDSRQGKNKINKKVESKNMADSFKCTPIEDGPNYLCLADAGIKPSSGETDEEAKLKEANGDIISAIHNPGMSHPEYARLNDDALDVTHTTEIQDFEMHYETTSDLLNPHRPNFASYDAPNYEDFNVEKSQNELKERMKKLGKLTGEDEMFAYKRCVSRIREMTNSKRWREWSRKWTPVNGEGRPWEIKRDIQEPAIIGHHNHRDEANSQAPTFKDYRFFGMGKWTTKAGIVEDPLAKRFVNGTNQQH